MKSYKLLKNIMKGIFIVFIMGSMMNVFAYAEGVYDQNFSDPSVLGASGAPTEWNNTGTVALTITSGQLQRSGYSLSSGSRADCNSFVSNGSSTYSFDFGLRYSYDASNGQALDFIFNRDVANNYYYLIRIAKVAESAKGIAAKSVNLIKRSSTAGEKVLASIPYSALPGSNSLTPFHCDIIFESDRHITVKMTDKNNVTTTILDRFLDTTVLAPLGPTGGKLSILSTGLFDFWVDNILVVNNDFYIKSSTATSVGENLNVTASAYVPDTFNTATFIAAAYDSAGTLVSVTSKPYHSTDMSNGMIACQDTLDKRGAAITKVKVFLWEDLDGIRPYCKSRDALIQ